MTGRGPLMRLPRWAPPLSAGGGGGQILRIKARRGRIPRLNKNRYDREGILLSFPPRRFDSIFLSFFLSATTSVGKERKPYESRNPQAESLDPAHHSYMIFPEKNRYQHLYPYKRARHDRSSRVMAFFFRSVL